MKKLTCLVLLFFYAISTEASTNITSPTVSGHWTVSGSPYLINNDIQIHPDSSLLIDPDVDVIFQGFYKMSVLGTLTAKGIGGKPIKFHVKDTSGWSEPSVSKGGWVGIQFGTYGYPSSKKSEMNFCNIFDMKGGILINYLSISLSNLNIYHNSDGILFFHSDGYQSIELTKCNIYNNSHGNNLNSRPIFFNKGNIAISKCNINNNTSGYDLMSFYDATLLLDNNTICKNTQLVVSMASTIWLKNTNGIIKGNKIYENNSQYDAALSCMSGHVDINGNYICNNSTNIGFNGSSACGSTEGGGAIRISAENDTTDNPFFTVRNNIIANNYAAFTGGAIYVMFCSANIFNNQIVNNNSGSARGIYIFNTDVYGHTSVKIKNNIFYSSNTPSENIRVEAADTLECNYNWSQNPFYKDVNTMGFGVKYLIRDTSTNLIGTTPEMINPTTSYDFTLSALTHDFRLLPTSTSIDKGIFIQSDTTDCYGNNRVYNGKVDIGAYEYSPESYAHTYVSNTERSKTAMNIYPNPASNSFSIFAPGKGGTIILIDISGHKMLEKAVSDTVTSFDIHAIPRGIYFAVWSDGSTRSTQRLIIE